MASYMIQYCFPPNDTDHDKSKKTFNTHNYFRESIVVHEDI